MIGVGGRPIVRAGSRAATRVMCASCDDVVMATVLAHLRESVNHAG